MGLAVNVKILSGHQDFSRARNKVRTACHVYEHLARFSSVHPPPMPTHIVAFSIIQAPRGKQNIVLVNLFAKRSRDKQGKTPSLVLLMEHFAVQTYTSAATRAPSAPTTHCTGAVSGLAALDDGMADAAAADGFEVVSGMAMPLAALDVGMPPPGMKLCCPVIAPG